ncbi:hypothetical protein [Streptomyces sp. NPDC048172]|uniref:hypothetical protein n=1 Tax=Streptomyces sp. NPDC048172 TaxID=3365505 RepID=UPI003710108D
MEDSERVSPEDEARIRYAGTVLALIDRLLGMVPVTPAKERGGELLASAEAVLRQATGLCADAVIAEREREVSYAELARVAGISEAAARERWERHVDAWAANGRSCVGPDSPETPLRRAATYDAWYAELRPHGPPRAVTAGLEAFRAPDAAREERPHPAHADELHRRVTVLLSEDRARAREYERLKDADAPEAMAANRLQAAEAHDALAALFDELRPLEPSLTEEHRDTAERHRAYAAHSRDHARLLAETRSADG